MQFTLGFRFQVNVVQNLKVISKNDSFWISSNPRSFRFVFYGQRCDFFQKVIRKFQCRWLKTYFRQTKGKFDFLKFKNEKFTILCVGSRTKGKMEHSLFCYGNTVNSGDLVTSTVVSFFSSVEMKMSKVSLYLVSCKSYLTAYKCSIASIGYPNNK